MTEIASAERDGDVTILRLTAGDNRFNPSSLAQIGALLDEFEAVGGPGALVITGDGKFFSNGLDLEWMASAPPDDSRAMLRDVHRLLARVLAFPAATVAAVNGHAFAAGAMLALACDTRVMREDRGFVCLPEVDLGLSFTPGMTELLKARLPAATAHEAMVTGRRYGGHDAVRAGIIDAAVPDDQVLAVATERAAALAAKPRATVGAIKRAIYAAVLGALEASEAADLGARERAAAGGAAAGTAAGGAAVGTAAGSAAAGGR